MNPQALRLSKEDGAALAGQRSNAMFSSFGGLFGLIILALDIWAILNVLKSGIDTAMKIVWVLLILLLPVLGLIIWAVAGPRSNLKF
jgi:hypothetical protein